MTRNELVRALMDRCPALTGLRCSQAARTADADGTLKWAEEEDIPMSELADRVIAAQSLNTDGIIVDGVQTYGRPGK